MPTIGTSYSGGGSSSNIFFIKKIMKYYASLPKNERWCVVSNSTIDPFMELSFHLFHCKCLFSCLLAHRPTPNSLSLLSILSYMASTMGIITSSHTSMEAIQYSFYEWDLNCPNSRHQPNVAVCKSQCWQLPLIQLHPSSLWICQSSQQSPVICSWNMIVYMDGCSN